MALTLAALLAASCGPAATSGGRPQAGSAATAPAALNHKLTVARHQTAYVFLDFLKLPDAAGEVTISSPQSEDWAGTPWDLLEVQPSAQTVTGPNVERVIGAPEAKVDSGSVLIPPLVMPAVPGTKQYQVSHAGRLALRFNVSATMPAGVAVIQVQAKIAGAAYRGTVQVDVQDMTLPIQPPALAVGSISVQSFLGMYPDTPGLLQLAFLDRNDPDHRQAVERLDALVAAAHRDGVALFLEDLAPVANLDVTGRVALDWDGYDHTVQPYMTGEAFVDHVAMQAWLVPMPPRRLRDTPAQLRQFWQACIEHAQVKGWQATPVLYHPALVDRKADPALRDAILAVVANLDSSVAVVTNPDIRLSRPQLWATDPDDTRLPNVGGLADEYSVRVWPWMCQARKLKGFLWRDAVAATVGSGAANAQGNLPLLTDLGNGRGIASTLRMAWLKDGLNDIAHDDLLSRRAPEAIGYEVMAGVVGRTGVIAPDKQEPGESAVSSAAPFLFAAWPTDSDFWDRLPAMMDKLVMAYDPGQVHPVAQDDPLYLSARMWLAQSHKPVARVRYYDFGVAKGALGPLLMVAPTISVQNPIAIESPLDFRWPLPAGNLRLEPKSAQLPALGVIRQELKLVGHVDSMRETMAPTTLQIVERAGGAMAELPVLAPVQTMRPVREPLRIDGRLRDWPALPKDVPMMEIATRYASRADFAAGRLSRDADPASLQWTYDAEWIYMKADVPQKRMTDDRSSNWPTQDGRWWGGDVLQIQIAQGATLKPGTKVIHIAIKPSGTVLQRALTIGEKSKLTTGDAPAGLRYAIVPRSGGYTAEIAMPRSWFGNEFDRDPNTPVWRLNVLRHQAETFTSTSWSGPIVDDRDLGMMGLLVGIGEAK